MSPPRRSLKISRRKTRCRPFWLGGPPPNARTLPFSELVASMRAVCACLHMEVRNVTSARCDASGPGIFCLRWAELVLGLLHPPPHGQGRQHLRSCLRSFVPLFKRFSDVMKSRVQSSCRIIIYKRTRAHNASSMRAWRYGRRRGAWHAGIAK